MCSNYHLHCLKPETNHNSSSFHPHLARLDPHSANFIHESARFHPYSARFHPRLGQISSKARFHPPLQILSIIGQISFTAIDFIHDSSHPRSARFHSRQLDFIHGQISSTLAARFHPRLDFNHSQLDFILHPHSPRFHPSSARFHPRLDFIEFSFHGNFISQSAGLERRATEPMLQHWQAAIAAGKMANLHT